PSARSSGRVAIGFVKIRKRHARIRSGQCERIALTQRVEPVLLRNPSAYNITRVNSQEPVASPSPNIIAREVAEVVEETTEGRSHLAIALEKALTRVAGAAWPAVKRLNEMVPGEAIHPKWAPAPLQKNKAKGAPQLGWPRETDSLCPR